MLTEILPCGLALRQIWISERGMVVSCESGADFRAQSHLWPRAAGRQVLEAEMQTIGIWGLN